MKKYWIEQQLSDGTFTRISIFHTSKEEVEKEFRIVCREYPNNKFFLVRENTKRKILKNYWNHNS